MYLRMGVVRRRNRTCHRPVRGYIGRAAAADNPFRCCLLEDYYKESCLTRPNCGMILVGTQVVLAQDRINYQSLTGS